MTRNIDHLPQIKHEDVKPMYSKEELLDKLATAVDWSRHGTVPGDQRLLLELIYSLAMTLK